MKIILSTIIVFIFLTDFGYCQTKPNGFSISYGLYSTNGVFLDELGDVFIETITLGMFSEEIENIRETGPILISYKYVFNSRIGLGMSAGYSKVKFDLEETSIFGYFSRTKIERSNYTLAAEIDFRYLRRANFNFYSLAGIGYTFTTTNSTSSESYYATRPNHFDLQLSFIGIRFGQEFGGFAELGLGYKGVINLGIDYRF